MTFMLLPVATDSCLLRMLRSQGLSEDQLNTFFVHGLIVSRLVYALPTCGVFTSVGQPDAFLSVHMPKWSFSRDIITFTELLIKSGSSLFEKMQLPCSMLSKS